MEKHIIYFDGGCKPNPGKMEICVVIDDESIMDKNVGMGTNNQAEWLSLIVALSESINRGYKDLVIYGDSQLVVNQASGNWKIKNQELRNFYDRFVTLKKMFNSVNIQYVPRDRNKAGNLLET